MIKTANLTTSVSRKAGGLFESVRRLVQSLADTGMDVRVFGTTDEHTAEDIAAWHPVRVETFRPSWPEKFGYSNQWHLALEDFAPDLTHTHGIWCYPSVVTNHYCHKHGSAYMISAHGMVDPWAIRNSRWKKLIAFLFYEGTHLRGAHCLRALCEPEARAIRKIGLRNPIAVVPNGIDLPRTQPTQPPPWEGRIEKGRKVLLFLSRIHPKKGLVNLLRAWAAVPKPRDAGWVLAIAGWEQGGHEHELKRLATEAGLAWMDIRDQRSEIRGQRAEGGRQPALLFLGPQYGEAKTSCYQHCDGFVLPSFSEGVPMVVLEAWAWRKPVLMTLECNLPEGFAGGAALRIKPEVDSIAHGLEQFMRLTDAERAVIGQHGFELVSTRYAWPALAQQMQRVYEWMLGGGPKPDGLVDF